MSEHATLLVVDDEELVLDMTASALEDGGYQVVRSRSGDEALALLERGERDYDALICDVNLGTDLDGWGIAQRARELRPAMPIVYTTGRSMGHWSSRGVPNSIVVEKPFSVDEIVAAVWTLLNGVEV